jgi:hypothetical protein
MSDGSKTRLYQHDVTQLLGMEEEVVWGARWGVLEVTKNVINVSENRRESEERHRVSIEIGAAQLSLDNTRVP